MRKGVSIFKEDYQQSEERCSWEFEQRRKMSGKNSPIMALRYVGLMLGLHFLPVLKTCFTEC